MRIIKENNIEEIIKSINIKNHITLKSKDIIQLIKLYKLQNKWI